MARQWSPENKSALIEAYIRVVRGHSRTMQAAGVDNIANRAHFLHEAMVKVFTDSSYHREITPTYALQFLRTHKALIESLRSRVDLQLKTEAARELGPNDAERAAEMGTGECRPILNGPNNFPIATASTLVYRNSTLLEAMRTLIAQLVSVSSAATSIDQLLKEPGFTFGELPKEVIKEVIKEVVVEVPVERIVEVPVSPAPSLFVGRQAGQLRTVFDTQPSVIIAGFNSSLTNNVSRQLNRILPYVRGQTSTLVQCIAEHPDASVLILAADIKVNARLEYLTNALNITVISVPNTQDGLQEAINHVNGYTRAEKTDSKPATTDRQKYDAPVESPPQVNDLMRHVAIGDPVRVDVNAPATAEVEPEEAVEDDVEPKDGTTEAEEDADTPDVAPPNILNRRVVFCTMPLNPTEKMQLRSRFTAFLDLRFTDPQELGAMLLGHAAATVLHFSTYAPMQATEAMATSRVKMLYSRSTYLDVFGKLAELESETKLDLSEQ